MTPLGTSGASRRRSWLNPSCAYHAGVAAFLIITDRQTGGVPVTTIDLARGLVELGDEVTLLAEPIDGRDLLPAALAAGVRLVPWPGQTAPGGLTSLARIVAERRWDAVLSCHRGCDVAVHGICTLLRRRHVIALHADPAYESAGTRFARLRTGMWRQAMYRAEALIAISAFVAERAAHFFPRLPPVYIVPNANARHPPATTPVVLPPPGSHPMLVACGRIYRAKQPELLLPLVQELDRLGLACDAVWIGGDDDEHGARLLALQAEVDAAGLGTRVRFAGHCADPWESLRASHVLVHFCTFEGFGLAVVEALAAGLPVAAFAAGALPELIGDGREGVLAPWIDGDPAGSIRGLAARLAPLLSVPGRHAAASAAALVRANDFTRASMAQGYRRALLGNA